MSTSGGTKTARLDGDTIDGNALGGPLAELFTIDLTAAIVTCRHCGSAAPLATFHVYTDAPALVVRCPSCTSVILRHTSDTHGLRFEMTGVRLLAIPATQDSKP